MVLKSLDASNKMNTIETLALMLEQVMREVRLSTMTQTITGNSAAYVAVSRILQDNKHFWSPCVVHVFDLLPKDIGKLY